MRKIAKEIDILLRDYFDVCYKKKKKKKNYSPQQRQITTSSG